MNFPVNKANLQLLAPQRVTNIIGFVCSSKQPRPITPNPLLYNNLRSLFELALFVPEYTWVWGALATKPRKMTQFTEFDRFLACKPQAIRPAVANGLASFVQLYLTHCKAMSCDAFFTPEINPSLCKIPPVSTSRIPADIRFLNAVKSAPSVTISPMMGGVSWLILS